MKPRVWWDGCVGEGREGEPCVVGTLGCTGHGDHPEARVRVAIEFGPSDAKEDLDRAIVEVIRAYRRAVRR